MTLVAVLWATALVATICFEVAQRTLAKEGCNDQRREGQIRRLRRWSRAVALASAAALAAIIAIRTQ